MKANDLILVIDVQNVYLKGEMWACLNTEGAVNNIIKIASNITTQKMLLTQFLPPPNQGTWKDYNDKYKSINESQYLNELVPQIKELAKKYPLYSKNKYSSLTIPEVLDQAKKAERLILTGVVSECCVLSTAFHAIDEGIKIIWLKDAVSGFDTAKEQGAELMLKGLFPVHGTFMTTEEYLRE